MNKCDGEHYDSDPLHLETGPRHHYYYHGDKQSRTEYVEIDTKFEYVNLEEAVDLKGLC